MIVCLKCLNEEHYVDRCISNFHDEPFCEKIIVIDGKSTDLTVMKLKKYRKVKVFVHEWLAWYHDNEICQSNIQLSYVPNYSLVMLMDFDEIMSDNLKEYLRKVDIGDIQIHRGTEVSFPRRTYDLIRHDDSPFAMLDGKGNVIISHQIGQYPDYQTRLLRKTPEMHWVNSPHHVLSGHTNSIQAPINTDIIHYEKNDCRERTRIEIGWARCQARRIELGLTADVFETTIKPEIAEYYDPDVWR